MSASPYPTVCGIWRQLSVEVTIMIGIGESEVISYEAEKLRAKSGPNTEFRISGLKSGIVILVLLDNDLVVLLQRSQAIVVECSLLRTIGGITLKGRPVELHLIGRVGSGIRHFENRFRLGCNRCDAHYRSPRIIYGSVTLFILNEQAFSALVVPVKRPNVGEVCYSA
jgi:hypothetical protein